MEQTERKIIGRECKFAVYCPPYEQGGSDLHVIKEAVHYSDGTVEPLVRSVKDFKRNFYITKKGARNHEQKKEWEKIDNLIEYKCTQSKLVESIARAIGEPWFKGTLRKLCQNQYIYGTDILSTAIIKKTYQTKYEGLVSNFRYATFDIETNVNEADEKIICATLTMGNKVYTAASKQWLNGIVNADEQVRFALKKYLGETVARRNIELEFDHVDTDVDVVLGIFKKAHEWKPDIIGIWNIIFDMKKVEETMRRAGIPMAELLSDPSVPREFRYYEFVEGTATTVSTGGVHKSLSWNERWHTIKVPASFYFVDAGAVYTKIRLGAQAEQSYGLDYISNKHGVGGKLKLEEAEGYPEGTLEWHRHMQKNHKFAYIIYNIQDCVVMLDLDEKTKDIEITMGILSGCSDFENFKSQPRRSVDRLHWFCLERGYVIGSTSSAMATEQDDMTLDLNDWIITLPAHLVMDNGMKIIQEDSTLPSNIRSHVGDLDVSASYPNGGSVFNMSKDTTKYELISIEGIREDVHRIQGINLSGGPTNAAEFCQTMFGLPTFDVLLEKFKAAKSL